MYGGVGEINILMSKLDKLRVRLFEEFPVLPIPDTVEQVSIYPKDSHAATVGFLGKPWDQVDVETTQSSPEAFIYFTPQAYHYYMPTMMLYYLDGDHRHNHIEAQEPSPIPDDLVRSPNYAGWEDNFTERWQQFTLGQLEVILAFIILARTEYASYMGPYLETAEATVETLILLRIERDDPV